MSVQAVLVIDCLDLEMSWSAMTSDLPTGYYLVSFITQVKIDPFTTLTVC